MELEKASKIITCRNQHCSSDRREKPKEALDELQKKGEPL